MRHNHGNRCVAGQAYGMLAASMTTKTILGAPGAPTAAAAHAANVCELRGAVLDIGPDRIQNFPCSAERMPNGELRTYYANVKAQPGAMVLSGFGRATGPWNALRREDAVFQSAPTKGATRFTIGGFPLNGTAAATQPVHVALPGGRHRVYFWLHDFGRPPYENLCRFVAAESDDDMNYNLVNLATPCLYQTFNDRAAQRRRAAEEGRTIPADTTGDQPSLAPHDLCCNDATTVYRLADGTFEIYTASLLPRQAEPWGVHVPFDNAPGWRRYIVRYTSTDGLAWKLGGPVVLPDEKDPPYLQFYYLAVHHLPDGHRIGFLGHYNVLEQSIDIELCFSKDGRAWERPCRDTPFIRRSPQEIMLLTGSTPFVQADDGWAFLYSSMNFTHRETYCTEPHIKGTVKLAWFKELPARPTAERV